MVYAHVCRAGPLKTHTVSAVCVANQVGRVLLNATVTCEGGYELS
jgi:hypothetical protein